MALHGEMKPSNLSCLHFFDFPSFASLSYPINRAGGAGSTAYNWVDGVSNGGYSSYFQNIPDGVADPSVLPVGTSLYNEVNATLSANSSIVLTASTIGYITWSHWLWSALLPWEFPTRIEVWYVAVIPHQSFLINSLNRIIVGMDNCPASSNTCPYGYKATTYRASIKKWTRRTRRSWWTSWKRITLLWSIGNLIIRWTHGTKLTLYEEIYRWINCSSRIDFPLFMWAKVKCIV